MVEMIVQLMVQQMWKLRNVMKIGVLVCRYDHTYLQTKVLYCQCEIYYIYKPSFPNTKKPLQIEQTLQVP